jgi:hypothetical protein
VFQINTWCLDKDSDEKDQSAGKKVKPIEGVSEDGRVIDVDEDYTRYGPFLEKLNDEQLSDVEVIVKDETLSKQDVSVKLESYAKEQKLTVSLAWIYGTNFKF